MAGKKLPLSLGPTHPIAYKLLASLLAWLSWLCSLSVSFPLFLSIFLCLSLLVSVSPYILYIHIHTQKDRHTHIHTISLSSWDVF